MENRIEAPALALTEQQRRTKALAMKFANMSKWQHKLAGTSTLYYRFFLNSKTFTNYRAGDRVLLGRQFGGFGDALVISCLINEIHDRYGCDVVYCCRETYMELYRNTPFVKCLPYDALHFQADVDEEKLMIRSKVANLYQIAIDLTVPCHIWEELFFEQGITKWQNRLDMWGNWTGLYDFPKQARTCIQITEEEIEQARKKYLPHTHGKPVVVFCLTSANYHKDYTKYASLLHNQITKAGYHVLVLGDKSKLLKMNAVTTQTKREFLALMKQATFAVCVDSAGFHAAGIFGIPVFGLFMTNDGECYSKYYPSAVPIQLCEKKCIWNYCKHPDCAPKNSSEIILSKIREAGFLDGKV